MEREGEREPLAFNPILKLIIYGSPLALNFVFTILPLLKDPPAVPLFIGIFILASWLLQLEGTQTPKRTEKRETNELMTGAN